MNIEGKGKLKKKDENRQRQTIRDVTTGKKRRAAGDEVGGWGQWVMVI